MNMGIIAASRLRGVFNEPNFFIGGVGQELTNESQASTMFTNISSSQIESFSIDSDNNISFYVNPDNNFDLESSYFNMFSSFGGYWVSNNFPATLTYFIDTENLIKSFPSFFFFRQRSLNYLQVLGLENVGQRTFQSNDIKKFYFPNLLLGNDFQTYIFNSQIERFYAPILNRFGKSTGDNRLFEIFGFSNPKKIYYNTTAATNNSGNPDGDIQYCIDSGFQGVVILNQIRPNKISNIVLSNIGTNSVDISFDAPTGSENTIDFYEIFLIDGSVLNNFKPITESTTNSLTLNGLESGKNYLIKVKAADIYFNLSDFETSQSFTTL